jgi:hypothetical protein
MLVCLLNQFCFSLFLFKGLWRVAVNSSPTQDKRVKLWSYNIHEIEEAFYYPHTREIQGLSLKKRQSAQ